jgi:hypothetical protein
MALTNRTASRQQLNRFWLLLALTALLTIIGLREAHARELKGERSWTAVFASSIVHISPPACMSCKLQLAGLSNILYQEQQQVLLHLSVLQVFVKRLSLKSFRKILATA